MIWRVRRAFSRLLAFVLPQRLERELDDELSAHISMSVDDYKRRGFSPEEARRRALIDLGGTQSARESHRDVRGLPALDFLLQDIRYAVRTLRRDALFAAMAVAILTVGIGATTAVFSIVNSVLLRPLDYAHAERLVTVEESIPQFSHMAPVLPVNGQHYLEWKRRSKTLEDVALINYLEMNLTGTGEPERLATARVTGNLFDVIGVSAQLGRTFVAEDGAHRSDRVVLITDSLWRRRFGASPAIAGTSIQLNGGARTVLGVLPIGFQIHSAGSFAKRPTEGGRTVEVYEPWNLRDGDWPWAGDHNFSSVGRLRKGVTMSQATAELNVIQADITRRFENVGKLDLFIHLTPLQEKVVGQSRTSLLMLLCAVGTVLLIACVNLGNLMLVRAIGRGREMAVRAALGASVSRIVRGSLLEGLFLSLTGATMGVVLARWLLQVFRAAAPAELPRATEVSLDGTALLFAAAVSTIAALICGLIPAWRLRHIDPQDTLRLNGRSMTDHRGGLRFREMLASVEVGLSVALLIVAGLLMHSAVRLNAVSSGFQAHNVLTSEVSLTSPAYANSEAKRRFYTTVIDKLKENTGIVAAGAVALLPLQGHRWGDVARVEGDNRPIAELPLLTYRPVTSEYFTAMGIPMLSGRSVAETDYPRQTAVLSARAAERLWPGQNAIGKRFSRARDKPFEVVGVVGDVRGAGLEKEPELLIYVPLWVRVPSDGALVIRTAQDPTGAVALLRQAVRSVDAQVPLSAIRTMSAVESSSTAKRRFVMVLVATFATAALFIAVLGTYSVLAYSVNRRKQEIGIRIALGAMQREVSTLVLRQGLRPVLLGAAGGVLVAAATGRFITSLLFEVKAHDLMTYAAVVAVTLITAGIACWLPARRASRMSPVDALRYD